MSDQICSKFGIVYNSILVLNIVLSLGLTDIKSQKVKKSITLVLLGHKIRADYRIKLCKPKNTN